MGGAIDHSPLRAISRLARDGDGNSVRALRGLVAAIAAARAHSSVTPTSVINPPALIATFSVTPGFVSAARDPIGVSGDSATETARASRPPPTATSDWRHQRARHELSSGGADRRERPVVARVRADLVGKDLPEHRDDAQHGQRAEGQQRQRFQRDASFGRVARDERVRPRLDLDVVARDRHRARARTTRVSRAVAQPHPHDVASRQLIHGHAERGGVPPHERRGEVQRCPASRTRRPVRAGTHGDVAGLSNDTDDLHDEPWPRPERQAQRRWPPPRSAQPSRRTLRRRSRRGGPVAAPWPRRRPPPMAGRRAPGARRRPAGAPCPANRHHRRHRTSPTRRTSTTTARRRGTACVSPTRPPGVAPLRETCRRTVELDDQVLRSVVRDEPAHRGLRAPCADDGGQRDATTEAQQHDGRDHCSPR